MPAAKAAPGLMYPGTRVVRAFRPDYSQVSIVVNGKLEGARLQPCPKATVIMRALVTEGLRFVDVVKRSASSLRG